MPRKSAPFPPELSAKPPPRRTTFAVALQLGRSFPSLIALVRAVYVHDETGARRASRQIARGILRGARDRSRQRYPRALPSLQQRTEPLTRMRLPTGRSVAMEAM
jgi:hypothetical protein